MPGGCSREDVDRIFVYGYFGWGNVGDDAIGLGILKGISSRIRPEQIILASKEPYFGDLVRREEGVPNVITIDFSLFSIVRAILISDRFIIAGGTHLHDADASPGQRLRIFLFFLFMAVLGNTFGKRPTLLGNGIGPLNRGWSKLLTRSILSNCDRVYVRDRDSLQVVDDLGFSNISVRGFDCASLLFEGLLATDHIIEVKKVRTLGISLLPIFDVYGERQVRDDRLADMYGDALSKLLEEGDDLRLFLFSFRFGGRHSDDHIINSLYGRLSKFSSRVSIVSYDGDLDGFIKAWDGCDAVVCMRYHSAIFSFFLRKPMLIVDYIGKTRSLADEMGSHVPNVIPLQQLTKDELIQKVGMLVARPKLFTTLADPEDSLELADRMFDELVEDLC